MLTLIFNHRTPQSASVTTPMSVSELVQQEENIGMKELKFSNEPWVNAFIFFARLSCSFILLYFIRDDDLLLLRCNDAFSFEAISAQIDFFYTQCVGYI